MSAADADFASKDEVIRAFTRLSDADLVRIQSFARYRCFGLPWIDAEDLLQEAIGRSIEGRRRWPKAVPFVTFLRETIRSIAFEELRHRVEGPIRAYADLPNDESGAMPDAVVNAPDLAPGPERQIAASQALEAFLQAFAEDPAAIAVLLGLANGESPIDICRSANITRTEYQSAQKRIRRLILSMREDVKEHFQ